MAARPALPRQQQRTPGYRLGDLCRWLRRDPGADIRPFAGEAQILPPVGAGEFRPALRAPDRPGKVQRPRHGPIL